MDDQQNSGLNSSVPSTQEPQGDTVVSNSQNASALPAPDHSEASTSAQAPITNPASSNNTPKEDTPQPNSTAAESLNTKFSSDSPQLAEDVDLIEKEWVNKAKDIVAKTKNDPNKQNIELNKFKADYLKTRL